jgi:long-chain acyl-CoA synthetase
MKDMIELAGGEKYSPQFIEGSLKFSPYIRDVMAVGGEDRTFVSALIADDFENVGRWAEKNRIAYTTFVDLSQRQEVYEMIRADVERVNASLPEAARVLRFILLHKEFDADEAEMTRTRKLRRRFLAERYDDMLTSIYDGDESVTVRAEVQYQDGREAVIETSVRVMSLEEEVEA